MKSNWLVWAPTVALALMLGLTRHGSLPADEVPVDDAKFFRDEVFPLLKESCHRCHGEKQQKSGRNSRQCFSAIRPYWVSGVIRRPAVREQVKLIVRADSVPSRRHWIFLCSRGLRKLRPTGFLLDPCAGACAGDGGGFGFHA